MNLLGVHTFAVASEWQNEIMEKALPRLHALGVRLVEIPLLRPDELDAAAAKALAERNGMGLVCSLGLPKRLDIVKRPDEAAGFLNRALEVTARTGAASLSGVPYGTLGYTSGKPRTEKEMDAVCRLLERAARTARTRGLSIGIEPCNRYETHLLNRASDARQVTKTTRFPPVPVDVRQELLPLVTGDRCLSWRGAQANSLSAKMVGPRQGASPRRVERRSALCRPD